MTETAAEVVKVVVKAAVELWISRRNARYPVEAVEELRSGF
jgi:hypothetical protein